MKALRYDGPGQVEVTELPEPTIGPGEVLVAVRACGICGTDVKTYRRGHPMIPPGAVLGHEVAGIVTATAHEEFAVGDRVAVAPYAPCRACPACARGHFSLCDHLFEAALDPGGFAETVRVPQRIADQVLLPIPDSLDFDTAALTEPLACCLHGLEALGVQRGRSLLIMGDGPMGLLQAALGKVLGAEPVILSGLSPVRLAFARQVADVVVDVSGADLAAVVESVAPGGVDRVMVSVGLETVAQEALGLVRKGGAVNLFAGLPRNVTIPLDSHRIHYEEVTVLGTFGFWPGHFRRALDLLAGGGLALSEFITARVPLEGVKGALEAAGRYEEIKTVMVAGN